MEDLISSVIGIKRVYVSIVEDNAVDVVSDNRISKFSSDKYRLVNESEEVEQETADDVSNERIVDRSS